MNIHLITFANTSSNFSIDRIRYEACQMKCFTSFTAYTEKDFDAEYWEKNKIHFTKQRGYGYWSWKTYFISKKLSEVNDGDVVIYVDTGCMLLKKNRNKLLEWCERARSSQSGILCPCQGPYLEHQWSRADLFKYINDKYNKSEINIFENTMQRGSGIILFSKNRKSEEFVREWNDIMENHFDLITDSVSTIPNHPRFRENRHDQSAFSMLSKIFNIETIDSKDGILDKQNSPIICARIKNDKNTWKKPIQVLYDNQIFDFQKMGGISRTFIELSKETDRNQIWDNFTASGTSRGKYQVVNSLFGVNQINNIHLIENGFTSPNLNMSNFEYCRQLKMSGDYDIFFPTFFDPHSIDNIGDKPFVMFVPDMIPELYPQFFGTTDGQIISKRVLCPKASAIFTCSENSKKDIVRILNVDPNKVHVLYLAPSADFGSKTMDPKTFSFPYILYVGQRNAYKRFNWFLFHSMKALNDNPSLKIICTGTQFNLYEKNLIQQLGLKNRIINSGLVSDVILASLYKYAKMFIYPSEYEGFGIPILESFKMDCLTLLNNSSCFPEIAGDAAIYFNLKEDSSDLSQKIQYALNLSDQERRAILDKQHKRYEQFSWKKSAEKMIHVFEDIVKSTAHG